MDDLRAHGQLLWAITSPRGYPLGEHRVVGAADDRLYNELVHVPLLVGSSEGVGAFARTNSLVVPADVFATVCDWFGSPSAESPWAASLLPSLRQAGDVASRDRVALRIGEDRALRTAGWQVRIDEDDRAELFAKPDDRWEVNEVSARCADITSAMREALEDFVNVRAKGDSTDLAALPPELVDESH
jgi:arylsulfatase A-like enzyme